MSSSAPVPMNKSSTLDDPYQESIDKLLNVVQNKPKRPQTVQQYHIGEIAKCTALLQVIGLKEKQAQYHEKKKKEEAKRALEERIEKAKNAPPVTVSMQWITCCFCEHREQINWIDIPNSIPECCEESKTRKLIYSENYNHPKISKDHYVHVCEYFDGDTFEADLPMHIDLFKSIEYNEMTGKVSPEDTKQLYQYYKDKTTVVENYDDTQMTLYIRKKAT
jgi:hypothetical protein